MYSRRKSRCPSQRKYLWSPTQSSEKRERGRWNPAANISKTPQLRASKPERGKTYWPDSWCLSVLCTGGAPQCCNAQTLPLGGDTWTLQHPVRSSRSNEIRIWCAWDETIRTGRQLVIANEKNFFFSVPFICGNRFLRKLRLTIDTN